MKRIIMCVFLTVVVAGGLLFAQSRRWPGFGRGSGRGAGPVQEQGPQGKTGTEGRKAPEKISISGVLGIAKGHIAVKSGDTTYYLTGLNRYMGFIDGLKEGASVKLEGYSRKIRNGDSDNEAYMRVSQLTLNGKTYDLETKFEGFMGNGGHRMDRHNRRNNLPLMNNRTMPSRPQRPANPGRR
ncbi:MAG: hypothetical protein LBH43_19945 [Treponema sp.]|nr:hypothetical protein [Treponema sp.]